MADGGRHGWLLKQNLTDLGRSKDTDLSVDLDRFFLANKQHMLTLVRSAHQELRYSRYQNKTLRPRAETGLLITVEAVHLANVNGSLGLYRDRVG